MRSRSFSPGFDPATYLALVTPEAKATGALYRRASEIYDSELSGNANSESLALVLEASRSESCALDDPAT